MFVFYIMFCAEIFMFHSFEVVAFYVRLHLPFYQICESQYIQFVIIFIAATKPAERYSYVLSVHSSKAVMVEEIETRTQKYEYTLADAVIQLALAKGKCEGVCILYKTVTTIINNNYKQL
jgi:hypothetical protein